MKVDDEELYRMIIEAVANDFEEFDTIIDELARWTGENFSRRDVDNIELSLFRSIRDGNVAAFEPSGIPLRLVIAQANHQTIRTQWFRITDRGIGYLKRVESEDQP